MKNFKEMDTELIWTLLEGQTNVLDPLVRKEEAYFRNSTCPQCGSPAHETFTNPRAPFSPGSPLPNKLLRCATCRAEFDPYTRLVTSAGTFDPTTGESA